MPESNPEITAEDMLGVEPQHDGESEGKQSVVRLKASDGHRVDDVEREVGDALDRVFGGLGDTDTDAVDAGWISLEELTELVKMQTALEAERIGQIQPAATTSVDATFDQDRVMPVTEIDCPQGLPVAPEHSMKTPLRPPPAAAILASRRGLPPRAQRVFYAPHSSNGTSTAPPPPRDGSHLAGANNEPPFVLDVTTGAVSVKANGMFVQELLTQYAATNLEQFQASNEKGREIDPVNADFLELMKIAHGVNGIVDRVDFQAMFRTLSERYGIERFDAYLINFLRLHQPLRIPRLADDSDHWQVSIKARVETSGPHAPPKILLFKADRPSQNTSFRHQAVELVYILQGLPLTVLR